jgi:hypothetical protein
MRDFHPTDAAFKPSIYEHQSPPSGNAILRGRDKGPETVPAIQSADCRDKMRAQIAASSGLFTLGCVLAAVAITLKIRLDTPQGPQPLARAIVTTHLQQLRNELALP